MISSGIIVATSLRYFNHKLIDGCPFFFQTIDLTDATIEKGAKISTPLEFSSLT
jgi:hypothetical protein